MPEPVARVSEGPVQPDDDWAARATHLLETGVELLRDKSVRPAFLVATAVVIVLAVLGSALASVVLVALGLTRLFENLVFSGHMWATYSLVGGIFVVGGVFLVVLGNRAGGSEA